MYFYRWYVHLINIIWTDELRVKSVFQPKFHRVFLLQGNTSSTCTPRSMASCHLTVKMWWPNSWQPWWYQQSPWLEQKSLCSGESVWWHDCFFQTVSLKTVSLSYNTKATFWEFHALLISQITQTLNHDVKCWCLEKKMLGGSRQLSPKADLWSAERITGLWKESRLIRKSEGCKMYEYVYVGLYVPCVSKSLRCLQSNMLPEVARSSWKFIKIMEDQCVLNPQIWVFLGVN